MVTRSTPIAAMLLVVFGCSNNQGAFISGADTTRQDALICSGVQTIGSVPLVSVGTQPYSATMVDLDGDGKLDLAVANETTNNVSVMLGNGDGTFQAPVSYAAAGSMTPIGVIAGDFNGDNKVDLVVTNYNSSNVSVFLGNGDGSFHPAVNYPTGTNPYPAAAGDFNGDSKLDLVTPDNVSGLVSVLIGNGDGSFKAPVSYADGAGTSSPMSVATGDFDKDGNLDLAVINAVSGSNSNVSVLLGNGNGTFKAGVNYPTGLLNPYFVTAGDLNADNKLDLLAASAGSTTGVSVFIGNGDGTFKAAVNYASDLGSYNIAVVDLNGDGKVDLAVANFLSNDVSVLIGTGTGTFQAPVNYAAGAGPTWLTAGDLNGDAKTDLAVVDYYGSTVSVLLSSGSGVFTSPTFPLGVNTAPFSVTAGDFNGDTKADLAVANSGTNNLTVMLGTGAGTFFSSASFGVGTSPSSVTTGDFDADGRIDLVVTNAGSANVSVLLGNGDGTFKNQVAYGAGMGPSAVTVGTFHVGTVLDLAVTNAASNNVSVFIGNGDGTFHARVNYATGTAPISVIQGDFSGDGNADLVVANHGGNVSVLIGNGNGTFKGQVAYAAGTTPYSVTAGIFRPGTVLDLAVANNGSNNVSVLLGNGNGTFQAAANYPCGLSPYSVTTGDFNGDAKLDLAVANENTNSSNVSILFGNGDGTFQPAVEYAAGLNPYCVTGGDFNGDGALDLVLANNGSNSVSVLLSACLSPRPVNTAPPTISGTTTDGQTLTVSPGSWALATTGPTYQWQRCSPACTAIAGATGTTYTLTSPDADAGATIDVVETVSDAYGYTSATSAQTAKIEAVPPFNTGLPTISGTTIDGQTLTATTGTWTGTTPFSYTYQWQRCSPSCSAIGGATGTTYTLTPADIANTIEVVVAATNVGASTPATSKPTAVIGAVPPVNTVVPSISGGMTDGQTLAASAGIWTGSATIGYSYQWQRCAGSCADIAGASDSTYVLSPVDVGTTILVVVTATNAGGSVSANSAQTGLIHGTVCTTELQCGRCQKCVLDACVSQSASEDLKNDCQVQPCANGMCDGSGNCSVTVALTPCRAAPTGNACDLGAECDGVSPTCPADAVAQDGTRCDDGNPCTVGDMCHLGLCDDSSPASVTTSCAASNPCTTGNMCDGTGKCVFGSPVPKGTSCADNDLCNGEETCDGAGVCLPGTTVFCATTSAPPRLAITQEQLAQTATSTQVPALRLAVTASVDEDIRIATLTVHVQDTSDAKLVQTVRLYNDVEDDGQTNDQDVLLTQMPGLMGLAAVLTPDLVVARGTTVHLLVTFAFKSGSGPSGCAQTPASWSAAAALTVLAAACACRRKRRWWLAVLFVGAAVGCVTSGSLMRVYATPTNDVAAAGAYSGIPAQISGDAAIEGVIYNRGKP